MNAGIHVKQREIIFVPFPFSDLSSYKKRPALVLTPSTHNIHHEDILCCALTSNLSNTIDGIKITNSDLDNGTIKYESLVKSCSIFSVNKNLIISVFARLNKKKSNQVVMLIDSKIKIVE
jgi:mRNA interferase MazF